MRSWVDRVSARELGVEELQVIKTSGMEDGGAIPVITCTGTGQVSTNALARLLGVKSIHPCDPPVAEDTLATG
jgi:prolyl-tRNA editing enzyme YbaK/EbsC (Cys-tRNA(Pro) deacylase)